MSIWFQPITLGEVRLLEKGTMVEHLGIVITEIGNDFLSATMPVDDRTRQPAGILHGGASVALAETLGSIAGNLVIDRSLQRCVGLEINANHIRSVKEGIVTGITTPVHLGRTTQVWNIEIKNEMSQLVCLSRITLAVLNRS